MATVENGYANVSITNEELQFLHNCSDKKPSINYNAQSVNKFKYIVLINLETFEGIPEGFVFLLPGKYEDEYEAERVFKAVYMEKFNIKSFAGTYQSTINCRESNDNKYPTRFSIEFIKLDDVTDIDSAIAQFNDLFPYNKD